MCKEKITPQKYEKLSLKSFCFGLSKNWARYNWRPAPAILISLGQIFNVPALRITKGGNEISPEEIEVGVRTTYIAYCVENEFIYSPIDTFNQPKTDQHFRLNINTSGSSFCRHH